MRWYLLPLLPVWIFAVFLAGKAFLQFTANTQDRWWGGMPLWMGGTLGVIVPVLAAGLFGIAMLVWP